MFKRQEGVSDLRRDILQNLPALEPSSMRRHARDGQLECPLP